MIKDNPAKLLWRIRYLEAKLRLAAKDSQPWRPASERQRLLWRNAWLEERVCWLETELARQAGEESKD